MLKNKILITIVISAFILAVAGSEIDNEINNEIDNELKASSSKISSNPMESETTINFSGYLYLSLHLLLFKLVFIYY